MKDKIKAVLSKFACWILNTTGQYILINAIFDDTETEYKCYAHSMARNPESFPNKIEKFIDKKEALKTINDIQLKGIDRYKIEDIPKGSIVVDLWDDAKFTLGMEYGAIYILMDKFDISREDIDNFKNEE